MTVTAYMQTLVVEAMSAGIGSMCGMNDALSHECQTLCGLEGRSWRILSHDATVQQRFPHVLAEQPMTLGALASNHHARVVARRRHHAQHLTRLGFDGNDRTNLSLHQSFPKSLQVGIQSQRQVPASYRTTVEASVLITALHTTMGVTQQNLHAFLTTQLFLVATLHPQLTNIVARLVVVILFDVGRRHLSDITQHMSGKGVAVLADTATLDIKARKAEHLLLEDAKVCLR